MARQRRTFEEQMVDLVTQARTGRGQILSTPAMAAVGPEMIQVDAINAEHISVDAVKNEHIAIDAVTFENLAPEVTEAFNDIEGVLIENGAAQKQLKDDVKNLKEVQLPGLDAELARAQGAIDAVNNRITPIDAGMAILEQTKVEHSAAIRNLKDVALPALAADLVVAEERLDTSANRLDSLFEEVTVTVPAKVATAKQEAITAAQADALAKANAAQAAAIKAADTAAKATAKAEAEAAESRAAVTAAADAKTKADAAQAAALAAAKTYADAQASGASGTALEAAKADATAKANAAKQAAIDAAALDATAKKEQAEATAAADAKTKADKALADAKVDATTKADAALAAAKTDAQTKADAAKAAAITAADTAAKATAKAAAEAAEARAAVTAAADAKAKADAAQAAALAAAKTYAEAQASGAGGLALEAAKADATTKADAAKAAAITAAAADATAKKEQAEATAAADAKAKADKALVDAKADATAKADKALADAKVDAKSKADAAQAAAITAADTAARATAQAAAEAAEARAAITAAADAKSKADAAQAAALAAAKTYAESQATGASAAALEAAKTDAQNKANIAKQAAIDAAALDATAKRELAESNAAADAKSKADKALADAKADATSKANAVKVEALAAAAAAEAAAKRALAAAVNVVVDPGVEDATAWTLPTGGRTFSFSTAEKYSGTQSLQIAAKAGAASQSLWVTPTRVPARAGETWRFTAMYKTTDDYNGTGSNGKLRLGNVNGSIITGYTFTKTAEWKQVGGEVTMPAGVTGIIGQVAVDHSVGTLWVDDLVFTNITELKAAQAAVDKAKADAIAAAAIDATTKANNALADAKIDSAAKANAAQAAAVAAADVAAKATAKAEAEAAEARAATTAAADAKSKADAAQAAALAAAKTYAEQQAAGASADALVAAKADAQVKANAAQAAAIDAAALDATAKKEAAQSVAAADAKAKADKALLDAKADATSKADKALADAKADATSKANAAQAAAITAADTAAKASAKAAAEAAEARVAITAAADAKAKADAAQAAALAAAKTYAESQASGAGTAALDAAKADATSKANAARQAAIEAAALDATAKKESAEAVAAADAKVKADQALADAKADATVKADAAKNAAVATAEETTITKMNQVANSKNATFYGTAAPTATNPKGSLAGDTYRRRNSSGHIIGEWEWVVNTSGVGSWVQRRMTSESMTAVDIGVLTTGTAIINDAVARKIAATTATFQTVDVGNITATGSSKFADVIAQKIAAEAGAFISLDIGTGTFGELDGGRIKANTVSTRNLLVGSFDNLVENPSFEYGWKGWDGYPQVNKSFWSTQPTGGRLQPSVLRFTGSTTRQFGPTTDGVELTSSAGVQVGNNTGAKYRVGVWVRTTSTGSTLGEICLYTYSATGAFLSNKNFNITDASGEWKYYSTILEAPNSAAASVRVRLNATLPNAADEYFFDDVSLVRAVDGSVIVNGSVNADHVDAQSVAGAVGTFVKADIGNLTVTGSTNLDDVVARRIAANTGKYVSLTTDQLTAGSAQMDTVVSNKLFGDIVAGRKFYAEQIVVATPGNIMPDPGFNDPEMVKRRNTHSTCTVALSADNDLALTNSNTNTTLLYFRPFGTPQTQPGVLAGGWIPVTPGEVWQLNFKASAWKGTTGWVQFVGRTIDGSTYKNPVARTMITTATQDVTVTATIPADCAWIIPEVAVAPGGISYIKRNSMVLRQLADAELIVEGAIKSKHVEALAIKGDHIAANTIGAGKLTANSVTATEIAAQTITANEIATNAITSAKIAANQVIAGKIAANAVTANQIAANAVTAGKIAANAVTATQIAAGSITGNEIAANSITVEKLRVAGSNMIADPAFLDAALNTERTTGSTIPNASMSFVADDVSTSNIMRFTEHSDTLRNFRVGANNEHIPVTQGDRVKLSFQYRTRGNATAGNSAVRWLIYQDTAAKAYIRSIGIGNYQTISTAGTTWYTHEVDYVITHADAIFIRPVIQMKNNGYSGDMEIKSPRVEVASKLSISAPVDTGGTTLEAQLGIPMGATMPGLSFVQSGPAGPAVGYAPATVTSDGGANLKLYSGKVGGNNPGTFQPSTVNLTNTGIEIDAGMNTGTLAITAGFGATLNGGEIMAGDPSYRARATLSNGFTHYTSSGWNGVWIEQLGKLTMLTGAYANTTAWGNTARIAQLPARFRPAQMTQGNNCAIRADGWIEISAGSGASSCGGVWFAA